MDNPEIISVRILGQEYHFRNEGDPDYIRRLAAYVDDLMKKMASANPDLPISRLAVLVAVNIADEMHRATGKPLKIEQLENQIQLINKKIDAALNLAASD